MTDWEREKIAQHFHAHIFETGSCNVGTVVKLPCIYFKIYNANGMYDVQVWRYGKQMPDVVERIKYNHLMETLYKYVCPRRCRI